MARRYLTRRSWMETSLAAARAIAMAIAVLAALFMGIAFASYARAGASSEASAQHGAPALAVTPLR